MTHSIAYNTPNEEVAALFSDYLEGGSDCPAFVLSSTSLGAHARRALELTIEAIGYASPFCSFCALSTSESPSGTTAPTLDAQALFLLIEALDPLFVIASDETSSYALGAAYRCKVASNTSLRLFGRPSVFFKDFEQLLASRDGKQAAWRLLKTLQ